MGSPGEGFVRTKSRHAVTWSLVHVQRLHERACATAHDRPLAGRTALVVGASYALTRNGHYLAEAQQRGAYIIGTNSSAPVMAHYGVVPDAIVVRESLDNSDLVRACEAPLVCVDICAHPRVWEAAGDRCAWFAPGYPRHAHLMQRLGLRPLFGGTAAFTSAVKLALEWGASRVVLAGASLAMEDVDGELTPYHPSAPRGALRGVYDGEDLIRFSGNDADDQRAIDSGQRPQPTRVHYQRVPSLDWSRMLPILDTLVDEREWLQIEAGRRRGVDLVQATEGGCGIVGWRAAYLADVVAGIERAEPARIGLRHAVSRAHNDALVADLRREAESLLRSSEEMLRTGGPRLASLADIEGLAYGAPLIETLAAWRAIDAPRHDPVAHARHVYSAMRDAAREALHVLHGTRAA